MFLCQWCCQASLTSGQEQEKKPMQRPIYVTAAFIWWAAKIFKRIGVQFSKATSFLQALMPKLSYEKCRLEFDKTSWMKEILCL